MQALQLLQVLLGQLQQGGQVLALQQAVGAADAEPASP